MNLRNCILKYRWHLVEMLIVWYVSFFIVWWLFNYIEREKEAVEYVYYRGVQSTQDNFEIYKDIVFSSDSVVYETVNVTWQDVLKCDFYDGLWFRYFSYYESKALIEPKDSTTIWVWQWEKPTEPARCYLDWVVVIDPINWTRKFLHITSNVFTIWLK